MSHENCNCNLNLITRRGFLDRSLKTSLFVAFSTLVDIPLVMKRALAEGNIGLNHKKLLFIWLRGANDGLNSVIPAGDSSYAPSRPTLAVPTGTAWQATSGGAEFVPSGSNATYGSVALGLGNGFAALHPSLKFLAPVYNAGNLALIHRVGYPRQSQSHFDSQRYWENGTPNNNLVNDGIFYRTMLEYLKDQGANASALTGVSIQSSLPLILRGSEAPMTNLTDPLRYDLHGVPNTTNGNFKASMFLNQANTFPFPPKNNRGLLELQYENLASTLSIFADLDFNELANGPGKPGNYYRDDEITDGDTVWATNHPNSVENNRPGYYLFPTTSVKNGGWERLPGQNQFNKYAVPTSLHGLFAQIKAAAIILNKTDAVIAGTEYGGFDTHNAQGALTGTHPDLNRGFGWAMYALRKYFTLYADKATWNNVVVVTLTEFGRTTVENATLGTDHADAGAMFVAGGGIKGYDAGLNRSGVYNCSPGDPVPWLDGPSGSMFGVSGRYLKRVSDYRQVLGKLIRNHLGATQNQLNRIIPGYTNEAQEHLLMGGTVTAPLERTGISTQIRPELDIV